MPEARTSHHAPTGNHLLRAAVRAGPLSSDETGRYVHARCRLQSAGVPSPTSELSSALDPAQ